MVFVLLVLLFFIISFFRLAFHLPTQTKRLALMSIRADWQGRSSNRSSSLAGNGERSHLWLQKQQWSSAALPPGAIQMSCRVALKLWGLSSNSTACNQDGCGPALMCLLCTNQSHLAMRSRGLTPKELAAAVPQDHLFRAWPEGSPEDTSAISISKSKDSRRLPHPGEWNPCKLEPCWAKC